MNASRPPYAVRLAIAAAVLAVSACARTPTDAHPAPGEVPSASTVLAAPAAQYVDAVNNDDLDAMVAAFAPDAEVVDVGRHIRGQDAIRTWAHDEVSGGTLQVLAVTPMQGGQDLLVKFAPAGSSGFRAHYRFTMNAVAVTRADLRYA